MTVLHLALFLPVSRSCTCLQSYTSGDRPTKLRLSPLCVFSHGYRQGPFLLYQRPHRADLEETFHSASETEKKKQLVVSFTWAPLTFIALDLAREWEAQRDVCVGHTRLAANCNMFCSWSAFLCFPQFSVFLLIYYASYNSSQPLVTEAYKLRRRETRTCAVTGGRLERGSGLLCADSDRPRSRCREPGPPRARWLSGTGTAPRLPSSEGRSRS